MTIEKLDVNADISKLTFEIQDIYDPVFQSRLFKYFLSIDSSDINYGIECLVEKLLESSISEESIIELITSIGDHAIKIRKNDMAADFHNRSIYYCKKFSIGRSIFINCVLNMSRVDFMRGSNPIETKELQIEALVSVDEYDPTPQEALLMMYTGLNLHFTGMENEGHEMFEKGLAIIARNDNKSTSEEAMPLIGWHKYLSGDFIHTIEYYEDMILSIENKERIVLRTMAYPPIIYCYLFLGEFQRAMILNEIIYRRALESKDMIAASFMHCMEGRIHISANDNENGSTIVYNALSDSKQMDFIWGQYYSLMALCEYHYHRGQIVACWDDLILMRELAEKHHIGRMYSSPFMLDVLKEIEEEGLGQIEYMRYEDEILRHINSYNIHMKGVALRHLAHLKKSRNATSGEVVDDLIRSVELLEMSGNRIQVGLSYIDLARIMVEMGHVERARQYATLAWNAFGTQSRGHFPNELRDLVDAVDLSYSPVIDMDTLWLELRHKVDANNLALKMVTQLNRILRVESGGIALYYNDIPKVIAVQNINSHKDHSGQYDRMLGWVSYVHSNKNIAVQVNEQSERKNLFINFEDNPRFVMCVPFIHQDEVKVVLYHESYYRATPLSAEEKVGIDTFVKRITPHLMGVMFYQDDLIKKDAQEKEYVGDDKKSSEGEYIFGISAASRAVLNRLSVIAKTEFPVLLTGETGVGKEVFAKEIYKRSGCSGPLVVVNCGAIPETLIESELFGYERGSFTGADQMRKGYFEVADGGTIFLDEIGELSLQAQVKLLRVLEEKEVMRIGSNKTIKVNFRLIAATNRNLEVEVEAGRFRSDLYFRLNTLPIEIPPLRERKADIPELVEFFISKYCKMLSKPLCKIRSSDMARLMAHNWPGNVREVENHIRRWVLLSEGDWLEVEGFETQSNTSQSTSIPRKILTLEEIEKAHIISVLRHCNGRISGPNGAAELLGIKRTTLNSRIAKLGIVVEK